MGWTSFGGPQLQDVAAPCRHGLGLVGDSFDYGCSFPPLGCPSGSARDADAQNQGGLQAFSATFWRFRGKCLPPWGPLAHGDIDRKPASPIPLSWPAPPVDTPAWSRESQNSVKVAPPKPVGSGCPEDKHRGPTPFPRGGHRLTAESLPYPPGAPARGGRRGVSESSPYESMAYPRGGYREGHDALHRYSSEPVSRESRKQQGAKEIKIAKKRNGPRFAIPYRQSR